MPVLDVGILSLTFVKGTLIQWLCKFRNLDPKITRHRASIILTAGLCWKFKILPASSIACQQDVKKLNFWIFKILQLTILKPYKIYSRESLFSSVHLTLRKTLFLDKRSVTGSDLIKIGGPALPSSIQPIFSAISSGRKKLGTRWKVNQRWRTRVAPS